MMGQLHLLNAGKNKPCLSYSEAGLRHYHKKEGYKYTNVFQTKKPDASQQQACN